ncbi:helix-turn-helix domain-containing protein [Streptomyces sp. NPDC093252]|uniref:helix-turn-helix domain-containing protein n=1 Tax=Streptomyces sp. NPDC093252 TaxID=3154980 RepID=UPI003422C796
MSGRASVAELLAEPVLAGAVVLAGRAGLSRPVTDVTWYAGQLEGVAGHLVVCEEDRVSPPYRLDALVRRAQQAGAAALLITADRTRPLLSSLRLADRLGIPVVRVENADPPRLLPALTVRVRAYESVRARTVLELLRQLGARRSGLEVLGAAGRVLAVPLSLLGPDGTPISGEPVALPPELRLDLPVAQGSARLLVHPVQDLDGTRAAAWLAGALPGPAGEERRETVAVGLAMTEPFVRAWLAGRRARADRDAAFRARVLAEVLAGRDSVSRSVVESALSLGWRLADWHVGVHLLAAHPRGAGGRDDVVSRLGAALDAQGVRTVAVVDRGDGWAAWTSDDREPPGTAARDLLRAVRTAVAALPRDWGAVAGIGRPHPGPGGLARTLAEARDAAGLARSHGFRPAVEHADELGVARLLATWQESEVTRAFAESALAPLRGPEHTALLATLRVFLESGGSVTSAAQTLGVHRNTVGARLRQVRELLGVDLDDPSRRLALQLACRALD